MESSRRTKGVVIPTGAHPLSKNISRRGPRNCRSLGYAPNEQNDFSISIRYWEGSERYLNHRAVDYSIVEAD